MKKVVLLFSIYLVVTLLGYLGQLAFLSYLDDGTSLIAYLHEYKIQIWVIAKIVGLCVLYLIFNSQYRHNLSSLWKNSKPTPSRKYLAAALLCSAVALWTYFDYMPARNGEVDFLGVLGPLFFSGLVWFLDWCVLIAYLHEFLLDGAPSVFGLPPKWLVFIISSSTLFFLNFLLMNPKEIGVLHLLLAHFLIYGLLFWELSIFWSLLLLAFFSLFAEFVYPWNLYMMNDKLFCTVMPNGHSLYWLTFIFLPMSGYVFLRRRDWV